MEIETETESVSGAPDHRTCFGSPRACHHFINQKWQKLEIPKEERSYLMKSRRGKHKMDGEKEEDEDLPVQTCKVIKMGLLFDFVRRKPLREARIG